MKLRIENAITLWSLIVLCTGGGLARTPMTAGDSFKRGATDVVQLVPRWKKGEKLRFELVKKRQKTQDGKVILEMTSRTELEIEIVSANAKGFMVTWRFGETKFDDPIPPVGKAMTDLTKKGWELVLEIDATGSIIRAQNWKELMANSANATEAMIKDMQAAGADNGEIANMRKVGSSMTREQIVDGSTIEARLFYMVLGRKYLLSEPIKYESEMPNVLGGEPFPGQEAFTLNRIDEKLGRATVTWTHNIAKEKARTIMERTLKDLASQMGKPAPEGNLFNSLSIDDAAEFSVDISSGWPQRLAYTRLVRVAGGSGQSSGTITHEDTTAITRKVQ